VVATAKVNLRSIKINHCLPSIAKSRHHPSAMAARYQALTFGTRPRFLAGCSSTAGCAVSACDQPSSRKRGKSLSFMRIRRPSLNT
jgi:hypothetical protein